ncbi:hypothetical protein HAZT_HAZT001469 [Hyalella azteca]|uniref:G-protein coupled receptors family 2 profile 2 domain-containing protein n=1 Tax=Hyalella azteca TaxID=294128 RepID=A0A6A0GXF7_HYAAZ|nr:hypothetical protein HAZT_HAZT001469 [Hyalella azteca]
MRCSRELCKIHRKASEIQELTAIQSYVINEDLDNSGSTPSGNDENYDILPDILGDIPEIENEYEDESLEIDDDGSVPHGDLTDSVVVKEVVYENAVAAQRERLLALMALHKAQCEEAAKTDQPHWRGCKRAWDQVLCWPPAPPHSQSSLPCPPHVPGMDSHEGHATRWCDAHGQWEKNPHVEEPETSTQQPEEIDLSTQEVEKWLPIISTISMIGYSISLSALLISSIVLLSVNVKLYPPILSFTNYRRLRCARNRLHLHLFASFKLRAVAVLLKTPLITPSVVASIAAFEEHGTIGVRGWVCRIMVAVWEYFILANYSWLLMEGMYLHNLIFRALFTGSSATIMPYVILGWGSPMLVIVSWSIARALVDNNHCWLVHSNPWPHWIGLRLPVAASVFLNVIFFLNIIRTVALKLRSSVSREKSKCKQLSRSTLVLVPLFGVHYCLLWGLSLSSHPPVELTWLLLDQVCSSFQGLIVAFLYCFVNGEVRLELRKLYYRVTSDDEFNPSIYSTALR